MGFSPGPVTSPAMAFNPDFSTRCQFLSTEQALNPIKRTAGYLSKQSDRYDIGGHTSRLTGQYCSMQISTLVRSLMPFLPLLLVQCLPALKKLASRERISWPVHFKMLHPH